MSQYFITNKPLRMTLGLDDVCTKEDVGKALPDKNKKELDAYVKSCVDQKLLVPLSKENGFTLDHPVTPSEYGDSFVDEKIPDDILIKDFDELVADGYGLWNYCLDDHSEILENGLTVVLVRFREGCRIVQAEE